MSDKQYGHDDARDYEPYFSRHLMAMTAEDLHSKGEIACELAYRDARIAGLEAEKVRTWASIDAGKAVYEKRIAELEAENQRLRDAAQAVSDGHWHERSYLEMRPLIRKLDDAMESSDE